MFSKFFYKSSLAWSWELRAKVGSLAFYLLWLKCLCLLTVFLVAFFQSLIFYFNFKLNFNCHYLCHADIFIFIDQTLVEFNNLSIYNFESSSEMGDNTFYDIASDAATY
jgi:hypothetical protein